MLGMAHFDLVTCEDVSDGCALVCHQSDLEDVEKMFTELGWRVFRELPEHPHQSVRFILPDKLCDEVKEELLAFGL